MSSNAGFFRQRLLVTGMHRYRYLAAVGRVPLLPYPLVIRVSNLFILFLILATLSLRGSVWQMETELDFTGELNFRCEL